MKLQTSMMSSRSELNFFNHDFYQMKNRKNQVSKFHKLKIKVYTYINPVFNETYYETFMKPNETFGRVEQTFRFHKSFMDASYKYLFFIKSENTKKIMKPNETCKSFIRTALRSYLNPVFSRISANETFFQVLTAKSTLFYNCKNYRLGETAVLLKKINL